MKERPARRLLGVVADNPLWVRLQPSAQLRTPTGGVSHDAAPPRPSQAFTMIRSGGADTVEMADGVTRPVAFTLIGDFDAFVETGDRFRLNERNYLVARVQDLPDCVVCTVVQHG